MSPRPPHEVAEETPPPILEERIRVLRTLYEALPWQEGMGLRVAVVRNGGALTAGVRLNWSCARSVLRVSDCALNAVAVARALTRERK